MRRLCYGITGGVASNGTGRHGGLLQEPIPDNYYPPDAGIRPHGNHRMKPTDNTGYPETNFIVLGLFLLYVVYHYLEIGYRVPILGTIRFEFILGSALVIAALPSFLSRADKAATSLYVWTVLLITCMAIMVLFSVDIGFSSGIFLDRVIKFAMLSLMIMAFVTNPRELRWFIAAFMIACMKMGQEGFLGTITGSMIWYNQGIPRLHGPTPVYAHPNSFSGMAIGTLPFIIYLFPLLSRWYKLAMLAQVCFVLDIVLYTGSRTGYVAFIGGVLMFIKRSRNSLKTLAWILAISIALIPAIPSDYIGRFESIFTGHDKEGASTEKREVILEDAWAIFREHPLGVGVGAFPIVRAREFGRFQDTHNLYFEVGTNLGIQGLIIFFGFIIAMQRTLNTLRNRFEEQIQRMERAAGTLEPAGDAPFNRHLHDLKWMKATVQAVYLFVFLRLVLGLFGMDLYEIYWWFSMGLTVALLNLESCAGRRTVQLVQELARDAGQPEAGGGQGKGRMQSGRYQGHGAGPAPGSGNGPGLPGVDPVAARMLQRRTRPPVRQPDDGEDT